MNSIFLRIYGGMLGVLVLVALLGAGGLHLLNQFRADDHRERLASGTFRLMAHNMSSMTPVERRRPPTSGAAAGHSAAGTDAGRCQPG